MLNDIKEYRYMDDIVKRNRQNALKEYLLDNNTNELKFYDLNIYYRDDTMDSKINSLINRSIINKNIVLNRYQIEILNILKENNLFLSAPTSFGKTFLMLEYIARNKQKLNNIIFIIPTLALMNELLKKMYNLFADDYNICINPSEELKNKNIFVFVPERSDYEFLKKIKEIKIDLLVFDEIYKLQAANTQEIKTDDRLIYMNKVYLDLVKKAEKIALLGPYINDVSFNKTKLDIVKYYTNYIPVYNKMKILSDNESWIDYVELNHQLIYFHSPNAIYNNIDLILNKIPENEFYIRKYAREIKYLEQNVSSEWYVIDLLKRGIGIHHGKTPMFLRKFYENEYNNNNIKILLCTNTLMEGINTPTDSLIIVDDPGSAFKLNNLIGRVGRLNVSNPVIGEIIISSESILNRLNDTSGWFDLKILAEDDEISTDDEIIYLNKKYDDKNKQKKLEEKIKKLYDKDVSIDDIINYNLQLDKAYAFFDKHIYERLITSTQFIDYVRISLELIKGPSYLFKTNRYRNLNYTGEYLPYKYYLSDLIINNSYKKLIDSFNSNINIGKDKSNTNLFIDSLYELNSFIKFKLTKFVNYVELYKVSNNDKNTQLQQFIGILSNYKSLETAYKILDDLGINEEDSKLILELLNVSNVISTSLMIRLIRNNKLKLLELNLSPFTKNNITNI